MIADEVEAMMAKHALAPKPPPPPTLPPTYENDPPLKPFERRPKPARWMEAPDVSAAVGVRAPLDTFVRVRARRRKHVKLDPADPDKKQLLAERDFSKYPPGAGVVFGGPGLGTTRGRRPRLTRHTRRRRLTRRLTPLDLPLLCTR